MKQFNKNTQHTNEIIYVSKAVLKKDPSRPHLEMIYCDGSRIMATDGYRLHVYTPEKCPLEHGYYKVYKATKTSIDLLSVEEDLQFPNINRVIPELETTYTFETTNMQGETVKPDNDGMIAQVLKTYPAPYCFNIGYLIDLLSCFPDSFFFKEHGAPLRVDTDNLIGVLMPKRC